MFMTKHLSVMAVMIFFFRWFVNSIIFSPLPLLHNRMGFYLNQFAWWSWDGYYETHGATIYVTFVVFHINRNKYEDWIIYISTKHKFIIIFIKWW